jgi:DNA-binding CsgD family transcriptional regulator
VDAPDIELILNPKGDVAHVAPETPVRAIGFVREAVRRLDEARAVRRYADPLAAFDLWQGLLAGRWSLVDHYDTDGRRFLLARRNDPRVNEPSQLTLRQRQILFYAGIGWSTKEVAYALGLADSTVRGTLRRALGKMRISTRAELIRLSEKLAHNASHHALDRAHVESTPRHDGPDA